jgi:hypothetical protein
MEIRRSISMFGEVKIKQTIDGVESEVVVVNLTANVNNGTSYNINVNFTNKALIDSTPENQAFYESEYRTFENAVKAELI